MHRCDSFHSMCTRKSDPRERLHIHVPAPEIKGDYFVYDEQSHSLIGDRTKRIYQLGDSVFIIVKKADLIKRQLDFILDEEKE